MVPRPFAALRLARLTARASEGDARAFRKLFATLHPLVYRYLAGRVRVRADAEDLTALTLQRFVQRIRSFDPSRGNVRAWVLRIARNALIDHLRSQREHAALTDVEHALADNRFAPDRNDEDPRLHALRIALEDYPPSTAEMFALRYGDGLRTAEIASLLDMSESAVKQRFSRTLRDLKRRVRAGELEEVSYATS